MRINYDNKGRVSSIITDIKSKDILTKKGKERYQNMIKFFSENFIMEKEYYEGDKLVEEAKNKGIDLSSAILIPHKDGVALCFGGYYNHNARFTPYINYDCHNFFAGWTFSIGCFADVTIYIDNYYFDGNLACVTKIVFLHMIFSLFGYLSKWKNIFMIKSFQFLLMRKN